MGFYMYSFHFLIFNALEDREYFLTLKAGLLLRSTYLRRTYQKIIVAAFYLWLSSQAVSYANSVKIVATIQPLALLANSILGDTIVDEPIQPLFSPSLEAHYLQLRPSERLQLARADYIFWNGDCFEPQVSKVLYQQPTAELAAVNCDTGPLHWWLNPDATKAVAQSLAASLGQMMPEHQEVLAVNLASFLSQLEVFSQKAKRRLRPYVDKQFLFFHDPFPEFTQYYSLQPAGVLKGHSGASLSLKNWLLLYQRADQQGIECIYSEPQFDTKPIEGLLQELGIDSVVLDPLGLNIDPAKQSFIQFQEQLINDFVHCFKDVTDKPMRLQ